MGWAKGKKRVSVYNFVEERVVAIHNERHQKASII